MNVTDVITYGRRTQALATEGVVSLLVPAAATGLVVSIGDVLRGEHKHQKFYDSTAEKLRMALMQANRDGRIPQVQLEEEETSILRTIVSATGEGMAGVLESFCGAIFSFVPAAIEMVVVPMFTIATWGIMAALPVVMSPEGLVILGAAGVAGLVGYLYHRWKAKDKSDLLIGQRPQEAAPRPSLAANAPQTPIAEGAAKGIRNNNPGNLEYAGQPYALPKTGRFAQFATQGQGLYNLGRQVELYYSRGKDTVREIVSTYAPANDNNTEAYIASVSKQMGISPDDKLDLTKRDVLARLMSAIIMQENGSNPYTQAQINDAAEEALGFAKNGYKDVQAATGLVLPVTGQVSSPFGHREMPTEGATTEHKGVDIAAPVGTNVYAANAGTVEVAGPATGYGTLVQIKGSDLWTRYGHLSKTSVAKGDQVSQGQKIGEVGNTGISTGSHLHFEVQPVTAKEPVDPATYLPDLKRGVKVAAAAPAAPLVLNKPESKTFINVDGRLVAVSSQG